MAKKWSVVNLDTKKVALNTKSRKKAIQLRDKMAFYGYHVAVNNNTVVSHYGLEKV